MSKKTVSGLTDGEKKFLEIVRKNAEAVSGGDFAMAGECAVEGITRQQVSGYVSSLVNKGILSSTGDFKVNGKGEDVCQIIIEKGF